MKLILCLTLLCVSGALSVPTVKLNNGQLFGDTVDEAHAFFSVPYAKPPIGDLRFQDPVPIGFHGDLNVNKNTGVGCIGIRVLCSIGQCATYESEDCLYLNVYVPKSVDLSDANNPPKADRPVVVWIHGGAFWLGAGLSNLYDGRYMAEAIDAIVVTMNYRLMPFGFLAMDSAAPGNMGFRDQQVVLQWVQDNIALFGGNRQQVTIWGESAGAQSVALHMISSVSAPLFSQGVMESNPVSFLYKTLAEAKEQGVTLAKEVGCLTGNFNCLNEKSSDEIVQAFIKVMLGSILNGDVYGLIEPFSPVIDGVEFTEQQADAFANGNWNTDKNLLIGTDSQEAYMLTALIPFSLSYNAFAALIDITWPGIGHLVTDLYAPNPNLPDYRDALGDALSHFVFTCSSRYLARNAVKTKSRRTNVYYFTNYHPLSGPDCPDFLGAFKGLCGYSYHTSELSYFWRSGPAVGHTYQPEEISYVNSWTSYLGNFVHSGDVNKGLDSDVQASLGSFVEWPTYEGPSTGNTRPGDWVSSKLEAPLPSTEQEPLKDFCSFWDGIGYDFKVLQGAATALGADASGVVEALNEMMRQHK